MNHDQSAYYGDQPHEDPFRWSAQSRARFSDFHAHQFCERKGDVVFDVKTPFKST